MELTHQGTGELYTAEEEFSGLGIMPPFSSCLGEAITHHHLHRLFHGTWVAALLPCTNIILCYMFQLVST